MFAKPAQCIAQTLTLVFTSVIAPVVVSVVVHNLTGDDATNVPNAHGASQKTDLPPTAGLAITAMSPGQSLPPNNVPSHSTMQPEAHLQVIVQGTGRTPDQALQHALRTALHTVIVGEFGTDCWNRYGQGIFDAAWRNTGRIIRTWKNLAMTMSREQGVPLYQARAAMEVDRESLLAHIRGGSPAPGPQAADWRRFQGPP